jgi:MFS transporter, SP family, inositol transporter
LRNLFLGPTLAAMVFTATVYLFWNLAAGTFGVFSPYILKSLGTQSQAASVALSCAGFVITLVVVVLVFMPFSDRSDRSRRIMWGVGALLNVASVAQLLIFPFNTVTAIALVSLFGIGAAIAGEPFYKTWSQELFPTMLRTTAQGLTFGVARALLGIWTFFVPVLASLSIRPVALILMIFLTISGVVGYFFMPNTAGKSLEEIEAERSGSPARERATA